MVGPDKPPGSARALSLPLFFLLHVPLFGVKLEGFSDEDLRAHGRHLTGRCFKFMRGRNSDV